MRVLSGTSHQGRKSLQRLASIPVQVQPCAIQSAAKADKMQLLPSQISPRLKVTRLKRQPQLPVSPQVLESLQRRGDRPRIARALLRQLAFRNLQDFHKTERHLQCP